MADCGVYRITCNANGRVYIGSSLSVRKRFWEHRGALRGGRHHSLLMQRAWAKYGEAAFSFEPLLYCSPEDRHFYEQRLIDGYDAANPKKGMNRDPVAKCCPPVAAFTGRKHTAESRRLMSERLKGRVAPNKGKPSPNRGVPRSADVRSKLETAARTRGSIDMDTARAIRRRHAAGGITQMQISREMGIPYHTVTHVIRNVIWREAA